MKTLSILFLILLISPLALSLHKAARLKPIKETNKVIYFLKK